ncbi:nucleoside deaminase [Pseudomonas sp. ADAK18]|nr:nucleoside deaminase [Pseudomonas sp. ADAK18]
MSSSKNISEPSKAPNISEEEKSKHKKFMRVAIEQAKNNKTYPFGAVIVNEETGEIMAEGVNSGAMNPINHGEIVVINSFVDKHGSSGFRNMTLYTTGEPCSMCMSAIAWCGIPRVVWASSIEKIRASGIGQISISAVEVAEKAKEFYQPEALIGGILASESDTLFDQRHKS